MKLLQYFIFDNKKYSHYKFDKSNIEKLTLAFPEAMRKCYVEDNAIMGAVTPANDAETVIKTYIPTKPSIQSGEFGEILSFHILLEKYLPIKLNGVKKWILKPDKNKASSYTDLILYSCSDKPSKDDLLVCAEVKTKSTDKNTNRIQDAVIGAEKDFVSRKADTLVFLKDKSIQRGDAVTVKAIERFQQSTEDENGTYKTHYKAIVLIDSDLCDEEVKKKVIFNVSIDEFEIIIICMEKLKSIYEQMYGQIPKSYKFIE
jgi:hypothetical protein